MPEIKAIKPIAMQNIHKLIFRAILSRMLIESIPVKKANKQPIDISQNPVNVNPLTKLRPISAARIVGTLIRNESFKADSLSSPLKRRNERVIPDREIPGKAENP